MDGEGVKEDIEEGLKWFKLAADNGHADAAANYSSIMGRVIRNDKQAAKYNEIAARLGHAECQYRLGLFYIDSDLGYPKDKQQGVKWLKMSANQGYIKASIKLSELGF